MSLFMDRLLETGKTSDFGLHTGDPAAMQRIGWREILETSRRFAGGLAAQGVDHGDSVAILAGEAADIAPVIQSVWLRGASFTMLHQPTPRADLAAWAAATVELLSMIDARVVVVGSPFTGIESLLRSRGFVTTTVEQLRAHTESSGIVESDETDTAILQLTSGTTGVPKAVVITHANLHHNEVAMLASSAGGPSDTTVSWLPLFHDMGMIGFLVQPMLHGAEAVCVSPTAFLRSPLVWPELITRYRGTMTAAPNFAYSILARRLQNAPDGAYDLTSLRFALNGAEPLDIDTIEAFLSAGARFGLRRSAMVAAYGMAESTLAVSFSALDTPIVVDRVNRRALEVEEVARQAEPEADACRLIMLGAPMPGLDVRVVDSSGIGQPARAIGEIEIRGGAVTKQYLTTEGISEAAGPDGWLPTGDLGYLTDDGQIVVSGRKKDVIIVAGRNIAPMDIERAALRVRGVRPGNAAAVRLVRAERREEFAVLVESVDGLDEDEIGRIRHEVSRAIYADLGVTPQQVLVLPRGALPKTPSGKIKRSSASRLIPESRSHGTDSAPVRGVVSVGEGRS
ncbi:fatty acyl-AMP ligase [Aldersonia sp. NBC_00410]|uniref:fatty acyl-AMP ligase n=1 Tax=Aldersonia sp. NBC_00410 TaxID=2975954 RepID=UPI0022503698|nr:fatty acyl-AMP ligase [Aldersonia sp. NBC_00410]MCX5041644.1 fatty acyl-AMP ligase [Aldersonia sp. NBC_00410]